MILRKQWASECPAVFNSGAKWKRMLFMVTAHNVDPAHMNEKPWPQPKMATRTPYREWLNTHTTH